MARYLTFVNFRSGPSAPSGYGAPAGHAPLGGGGGGGGAPPAGWRPNIPVGGPRTPKVGRAGEARTLPAISGTARIPVCSGCGTAIR